MKTLTVKIFKSLNDQYFISEIVEPENQFENSEIELIKYHLSLHAYNVYSILQSKEILKLEARNVYELQAKIEVNIVNYNAKDIVLFNKITDVLYYRTTVENESLCMKYVNSF
jgi:hypothetical protein